MCEGAHEHFTENPDEFRKFVEVSEKPLYPRCHKHTKLSGLVTLYNLKARHGMTNNCFSDMLIEVGDLLPIGQELPLCMYEAKKTLNALGLKYEKIHACYSDCILYRNKYHDLTTCPKYGLSRWKVTKKKGVPMLVLWYFPPIPRFKRMFKSFETSKSLTWHDESRIKDGRLCHPTDSPSWKMVDHMWLDFASEHRNLRLALSSDGINPHSSLSSRYSCWPVILVIYNLPPELCMKRKFMILTLLISGHKQHGNDIDVYLELLIEDLRTLWDGVEGVYDVFRQQSFTLRAVLLWTINDFPAYGNLFGCTTKGYYACPICGEKTYAERLEHGNKMAFTGHRRFLSRYHPYRKLSEDFNGKEELDSAPKPLTGEQVWKEVEAINYEWGKGIGKRKDDGCTKCYKKRSIFFDLPYWKSLYVRHCLNVMHIEKNVCESIFGTLLNIPGKTKDGVATRKDLVKLGIRTSLAPQVGEKRTFLPPAMCTLNKKEKIYTCKALMSVKVLEALQEKKANVTKIFPHIRQNFLAITLK
ncbi:PREDICTED: uncharacterized protein LOC103335973 [Prunus mume]|uniref:Uncharacterized protein LOC103335973 n=1 Tax=Prunus mume TaxID=102107 RepID=A0ABM0PBM6_PRUMU|nr:PREDICTED: uncharacterized protein LOC103335973 [Prunus mume]